MTGCVQLASIAIVSGSRRTVPRTVAVGRAQTGSNRDSASDARRSVKREQDVLALALPYLEQRAPEARRRLGSEAGRRTVAGTTGTRPCSHHDRALPPVPTSQRL